MMHGRKITYEKAFGGRLTARATFAIFTLLMVAPFCFAQQSGPKSFSSPEEASHALFVAVKADNDQALMQILGAGKELVSLEDKGQDKQEREEFVNKYQEMHRLVREPDQTMVLYIGAENWPFPVPLLSRNGAWHFDSKTGMREVLFRQIGENETKAIEACHALVAAERELKTKLDGEAANHGIRTLQTNSKIEGSVSPQSELLRSHGYYFRILPGQKNNAPGKANNDVSGGNTGFTLVAYPVEYRKSGVMTFIVSQDDIVYQRDLGPNTGKFNKSMTKYKLNAAWRRAN